MQTRVPKLFANKDLVKRYTLFLDEDERYCLKCVSHQTYYAISEMPTENKVSQHNQKLSTIHSHWEELFNILYSAVTLTKEGSNEPVVPGFPCKEQIDAEIMLTTHHANKFIFKIQILLDLILVPFNKFLMRAELAFLAEKTKRKKQIANKNSNEPNELKEPKEPKEPIPIPKIICLFVKFLNELKFLLTHYYDINEYTYGAIAFLSIPLQHTEMCKSVFNYIQIFTNRQNKLLDQWIQYYPEDPELREKPEEEQENHKILAKELKENEERKAEEIEKRRMKATKIIIKLVEEGADAESRGNPFSFTCMRKHSLTFLLLKLGTRGVCGVGLEYVADNTLLLKKILDRGFAPFCLNAYRIAISRHNDASLQLLLRANQIDKSVCHGLWVQAIESGNMPALGMLSREIDPAELIDSNEINVEKSDFPIWKAAICSGSFAILEFVVRCFKKPKTNVAQLLVYAIWDPNQDKCRSIKFLEILLKTGLEESINQHLPKHFSGAYFRDVQTLFPSDSFKDPIPSHNITPLIFAVIKFSVRHVELLLQHGADVAERCARHWTPIEYGQKVLEQYEDEKRYNPFTRIHLAASFAKIKQMLLTPKPQATSQNKPAERKMA